jgi:hypothetical protein
MHLSMRGRLLWLIGCHCSTLVSTH